MLTLVTDNNADLHAELARLRRANARLVAEREEMRRRLTRSELTIEALRQQLPKPAPSDEETNEP